MRKYIITFFLFALILSACSSRASAASSNTELSTATKLIVGTFKLEGTPQAITSKEAKQLLPLWQVYSEMIKSDTAAQEEIDGLVAQIQETMTSEQTQAIDGMDLTQQDIFTVMQEQGGATRSKVGGTQTPSNGGRDFGPPGGGPGGDFFMGGGFQRQSSSSSQNSSSNSRNTQNTQSAQSSRLTSRLLETLISFLEKKAQQ